MSETKPLILEERRGRVTILTLNRPEVRNAMSGALVTLLLEKLRAVEADAGVTAVVLTGAGKAFCAGADLREIQPSGIEEAAARVDLSLAMHQMFPSMSKPVIAAVNGHALAGGCGLALAADIVIAADNADFGYPELPRGLVAALVMVKLGRLVPQRKALELLFTGRRVPAAEALELGMINEVVPAAQVMERAMDWAAKLADYSPLAMSLTKSLYYEALDMDFDRALKRARDVNLVMRRSDGAMSGAASFFKKSEEART